MPANHRRFLLSFEAGPPDWSLLNVAAAEALPAVRWRMENLNRIDATHRERLVAELETALNATKKIAQGEDA